MVIKEVIFAVHDAKATAKKWSSILDIPISKDAGDDPEWNGLKVVISLDHTDLIFIESRVNHTIRELITARGERPLAVQLSPSIFYKQTLMLDSYYK
ncbi:hypothetical protein [Jeotgalibacillus soli]|uniref:Glyoxalase-like domain-containing protein n=1 Tax=Jeotgalibacillus soli TaxID=889306 RepID=A0A0C2V940_9BACL|nr:hypothetical protein [Jeotgalibacillus soli]KIL45482.1 hypothetical protein KP78_30260 [Jeotgalibacillus soli]